MPAAGFSDPRLDNGGHLGEATQRRLKRAMDLGERTFSVVLFAGFAMRLSQALTLRPWDAMVIFSEALVVIFIVLRRGALEVSTRPMDWLFALAGTAAPMVVRAGGHPIAPPVVGVGVMLAGMMLGIWGKLMLSRSFGLAAANRGVVSGGPYALVRHPIYAGYVIVYIGFFSLNPTAWNAAVYATVIALLVARILAEERVLSKDPDYAAFMGRVRYRLAPGLF
jgi:protein-S-isoprenylcysteine O-methyltransferase Ste14